MEIVRKAEHRTNGRWRNRGHVDRLQALVEAEAVGDTGKTAAVAADETGERAVRSVGRAQSRKFLVHSRAAEPIYAARVERFQMLFPGLLYSYFSDL